MTEPQSGITPKVKKCKYCGAFTHHRLVEGAELGICPRFLEQADASRKLHETSKPASVEQPTPEYQVGGSSLDVVPPGTEHMKAPDGLVGKIYGVKVLPNTATELAIAIYEQKDLSIEDAMDMALYLDDRYKMTGNIPTSRPDPSTNSLESVEDILHGNMSTYDAERALAAIEANYVSKQKVKDNYTKIIDLITSHATAVQGDEYFVRIKKSSLDELRKELGL